MLQKQLDIQSVVCLPPNKKQAHCLPPKRSPEIRNVLRRQHWQSRSQTKGTISCKTGRRPRHFKKIVLNSPLSFQRKQKRSARPVNTINITALNASLDRTLVSRPFPGWAARIHQHHQRSSADGLPFLHLTYIILAWQVVHPFHPPFTYIYGSCTVP